MPRWFQRSNVNGLIAKCSYPMGVPRRREFLRREISLEIDPKHTHKHSRQQQRPQNYNTLYYYAVDGNSKWDGQFRSSSMYLQSGCLYGLFKVLL